MRDQKRDFIFRLDLLERQFQRIEPEQAGNAELFIPKTLILRPYNSFVFFLAFPQHLSLSLCLSSISTMFFSVSSPIINLKTELLCSYFSLSPQKTVREMHCRYCLFASRLQNCKIPHAYCK